MIHVLSEFDCEVSQTDPDIRTNPPHRWTRVRLATVLLFILGPPLFALPIVTESLTDFLYHEPDVTSPDRHSEWEHFPAPSISGEQSRREVESTPENAAIAASSRRSRQIQEDLQAMGASYTLLEQYGQRERVFRCVCRVDDAEGGRTFETTGHSPLEAMESMRVEVHRWKHRR